MDTNKSSHINCFYQRCSLMVTV